HDAYRHGPRDGHHAHRRRLGHRQLRHAHRRAHHGRRERHRPLRLDHADEGGAAEGASRPGAAVRDPHASGPRRLRPTLQSVPRNATQENRSAPRRTSCVEMRMLKPTLALLSFAAAAGAGTPNAPSTPSTDTLVAGERDLTADLAKKIDPGENAAFSPASIQ